MDRIYFALGSLLALLAVALGAFAAHGLRPRLSAEALEWWELAVRYQFYHALALFAVAWAVTRFGGALPGWAGGFFVAGVAIFCGSLYAMALGAPRWLGAITPVGGTAFLIGWLLLALTALKR